MDFQSRDEIIKKYFAENYSYEQIRQILSINGFSMSYRHLQRITHDLGLRRKNIVENLPLIVAAIINELQGSGSCLGYKSMWLRLKLEYGLQIYRETVVDLLRVLDPDGVELRARYKLHRRVYRVPGPNFAWHLDGYDKLKPFGFSIHGCIDGYSRKVLWFEVATTNNKPEVITYYYLKAVQKYNLVPTLVRSDRGSENSIIDKLQQAFRLKHDDELAGMNSFVKGKSTANQRIESTWGRMRRHCVEFWIFFKDMRDKNLFDRSNAMQLECLRYCFGPLISLDLQKTKKEWNRHNIRKQQGEDVIAGKPNYLYYVPEASGARDCGHTITDKQQITNAFKAFSIIPKYCDPSFSDLVNILLPEVSPPASIEEASMMYIQILNELNKYE